MGSGDKDGSGERACLSSRKQWVTLQYRDKCGLFLLGWLQTRACNENERRSRLGRYLEVYIDRTLLFSEDQT